MFDAIVVGARCAGAPTAMLLARKDYRVLLVDKSTFPSDQVLSNASHMAARYRVPRPLGAAARDRCQPLSGAL